MRTVAVTGAAGSIRVNSVDPSWVDTAVTYRAPTEVPDATAIRAMVGDARIFGRLVRYQEITDAIMFLLCNAASPVTGGGSIVYGGSDACDERQRPDMQGVTDTRLR